MSIAPIIRTVSVQADPAKAFEWFTTRMKDWWPHSASIGASPPVDVVVEPRLGGRWFERDADGHECEWGKVLAWEPPQRLLLAWQIGADWAYHAELITELELSFIAQPLGGTLVRLEHRHLERLGADAARHRDLLDGGWPGILTGYQNFTNTTA